MAKRAKTYIAVIGKGVCNSSEAAIAVRVGKLIAEADAVLVTGGLGGTMEAACRGAKEASGITIGILPGNEFESANEFVDHAICTGLGEARNFAIVMTADGLIALPGEFGTLSEISFALKYDKPVVSLNSWDVSDRLIKVKTPEEAVKAILHEVNK